MTSLATDGPAGGKLHPKLRTMLDAATGVNIMRAQQSGSVCVSAETLRANAIPPLDVAAPVTAGALSFDITDLTPLEAPPEAEFSTFIELRQDITAVEEGELTDLLRELGSGFSRKGNLIAADLAAGAVDRVQRLRAVSSIAPGEPLRLPLPKIGRSSDDLSREDLALDDLELPVNSPHVLIGIIDVGGFDFSHEDFRDGDRTRFWRIWDQAGTSRPGGPALNNLTDFTYGSEILQQHMNDAIAAEDQLGIAAYELEPQSVRTPGSHGTHVASIAAGNQGVCPQAHIAGVLLALGEGDTDARLSFYDSTRIAHAIEYLLAVAADLGEELGTSGPVPISINISLGTNGHAHDASSEVSRWIDYALSTPGRSVTVAAGNAGQTEPADDGDFGFIMGRIHASGQIAATDLAHELRWIVVGNELLDISENELELWYAPQDRFSVDVVTPNGQVIGPIAPGVAKIDKQLDDGTFISIYNDLYVPANGANRIAVYLSPFFAFNEGAAQVVGVQAGLWRVRIHGDQVRDGRYHAWIERDDPRRVGTVGALEAWQFPSFFAHGTFVDRSTVSSLACGQRVLSVANVDTGANAVSITSSEGPTRDGREKPDIGAPGTRIVAANGFALGSPWIEMSGTSMAAPYVTGVIGLMLCIDPELTAAQIGGIIKRAAHPLPGHDFRWRQDAGYGLIDPAACLQETRDFRALRDGDVS